MLLPQKALTLLISLSLLALNAAEPSPKDKATPDHLNDLIDRETACIALGTCPGSDPGASSGGSSPSSASVPAPVSTAGTSSPSPSDGRTTCQPAECPQYCSPGDSVTGTSSGASSGGNTATSKRSFSGAFSSQWLRKRFFTPTDPNKLVNELLEEPYCQNLASEDDTPSTYFWHAFDNNEYASATKGLSGCTAILIASSTGVFTSHIWEEDPNTHGDLQPANYAATLQTLSTQLSPHAADLAGGEAWIMLPTQPNSGSRLLYPQNIVDAITNTVNTASGLTAQVTTYIPLDWKRSPTLGTNYRGTAAVQYDPDYNGKKAYRLWSEQKQLSEKTF